MLGVKFGQKQYVLTILKDVEDEVRRSATLKSKFPWFDGDAFVTERVTYQVRLSKEDKAKLDAAQSIFWNYVVDDPLQFTKGKRSPPSLVDCRVLAFGLIKNAHVVTDDLGMHDLASVFGLKKSVWHGYELLAKMLTAKLIDKTLVMQIFDALENNQDLPATWQASKHGTFRKVFGKAVNNDNKYT
jgi:predicted nuclease of predicted toxin-antitoxin system